MMPIVSNVHPHSITHLFHLGIHYEVCFIEHIVTKAETTFV